MNKIVFKKLVEEFRQWKKGKNLGSVTYSDIRSLREEYRKRSGSAMKERTRPIDKFEEKIQALVDKADKRLIEARRFTKEGSKRLAEASLREALDIVDEIEESTESYDGLDSTEVSQVADTVEDILDDTNDLASQIGMEIAEDELGEDIENEESLDALNDPLLESYSKPDRKAILKLVEATKHLNKAKKLFEEVDDAAALQEPLDAAAQASVDAAGVPQVSEDVKSNIATIQTEINNLAMSIGIEPTVNPEAQPEAGVPPVTDTAAMPAPAPMQEKESIKAIKQRIVERRQQFNKNQKMEESTGIPEIVDAIIASTGYPGGAKIPGAKANTASPEQMAPRAVSKDIAGDGKGIRWPNKKMEQNPDLSANLKGEVQNFKRKKVLKESETTDSGDKHVDDFLRKTSLDFKSIYTNGILNA